jgi:hypothetical protein
MNRGQLVSRSYDRKLEHRTRPKCDASGLRSGFSHGIEPTVPQLAIGGGEGGSLPSARTVYRARAVEPFLDSKNPESAS